MSSKAIENQRNTIAIATSDSIHSFAPKLMKVGVFTAALQELTPRVARDADPDRAIEDWILRRRPRRAAYPVVGGAASVTSRRAARSDARSCGKHAGPEKPV